MDYQSKGEFVLKLMVQNGVWPGDLNLRLVNKRLHDASGEMQFFKRGKKKSDAHSGSVALGVIDVLPTMSVCSIIDHPNGLDDYYKKLERILSIPSYKRALMKKGGAFFREGHRAGVWNIVMKSVFLLTGNYGVIGEEERFIRLVTSHGIHPDVNIDPADEFKLQWEYAGLGKLSMWYFPHYESVRLMLEAGADLRKHKQANAMVLERLFFGPNKTPTLEFIKFIKLFASYGWDVNQHFVYGKAVMAEGVFPDLPLHCAYYFDLDPSIIQLLMDLGADETKKDFFDRTAIDYKRMQDEEREFFSFPIT